MGTGSLVTIGGPGPRPGDASRVDVELGGVRTGGCGAGGGRLVDPEGSDPPDEDTEVDGAIGVGYAGLDGERVVQFGVVVDDGVGADELKNAAGGEQRHGCGGKADGDALGVAAPACMEAAAEVDDEYAELDGEYGGEDVTFLADHLHKAHVGQLGRGHYGFPGGPGSPGNYYGCGDGDGDERCDEPGGAAGGGEGTAGDFDEDEKIEEDSEVGEGEEKHAQGDGCHVAVEEAVGEEAEGEQSDAGGEPGEAADALAPDEDGEEHEKRCESQRPEDLDGGKREVKVHETFAGAAGVSERALL